MWSMPHSACAILLFHEMACVLAAWKQVEIRLGVIADAGATPESKPNVLFSSRNFRLNVVLPAELDRELLAEPPREAVS